MLKLAQQYLAFIEKAKEVRIELAADYLVMAAWLAYLKSRLLLPQMRRMKVCRQKSLPRTCLQLERLQAMRNAAAQLMARDQKGETFCQGLA